MTYTIKHKASRKYFAGFDSAHRAVWTGDAAQAWKDSRIAAECQASLLWMADNRVQKKPVAQ